MKADPAIPTLQIKRAILDDTEAIASVLHASFEEFELLYTASAFAATTPTSDQIREHWSEGPVWIAT